MRRLACLLLVALPALAAQPGTAASARQRPMVILSCDSYERLIQSVVLGLGGIGLPEAVNAVKEQLGAMLLTPSMVGVDVRRPAHLFLLAPEPPDEPPTPVALLPLTGNGQPYLAAMRGLFDAVEEAGGVRVFTAPKDTAFPEPLYVAVAEEHAMAALRLEDLRWLAARRRDRNVPAAAALDAPLRLTFDAPNCGVLLGLIAMGDGQELLLGLGRLLDSFDTIDVGLDADSLNCTLLLRLNTASNTPLAKAVASLPAMSPDLNRLFPVNRLGGGAGTVAGLLPALSHETQGWLERLADATRLLGLQIAPGGRGWLAALSPHLNGEHAVALLPAVRGSGMTIVRSYGLKSAGQAEAALALLCEPPPGGVPLRAAARLPPRRHGATIIRGYRLAAGASTAAAPSASTTDNGRGIGPALTRLLDMNTVEMAIVSNRLIVIQGAVGDMERWLQRPETADRPATDSAWRQPPVRMAAGANVIGKGSLAAMAALRATVALLPGITPAQLASLPQVGGGLNWQLTRQESSLVWRMQISSSEIFAWSRLRGLDPELLQAMISQLILVPAGEEATHAPLPSSPAQRQETSP